MTLNLYYQREIILTSDICLGGWRTVTAGSKRDKSNWESSLALQFGFKSGRILKIATSFVIPYYFGGNQYYYHLSKTYLPVYKFCPTFCEISLKENTITMMAYS